MICMLKLRVSATAPLTSFTVSESPLELAVQCGLTDAVEFIWRERPEVRSAERFESAAKALGDAAMLGHTDCIRILLADPSPLSADSTDEGGSPPLLLACENVRVAAVQVCVCVSEGIDRWGLNQNHSNHTIHCVIALNALLLIIQLTVTLNHRSCWSMEPQARSSMTWA